MTNYKDLVERIRDTESGKNTLIRLDELMPLALEDGMSIIVVNSKIKDYETKNNMFLGMDFRELVHKKKPIDSVVYPEKVWGLAFIDREWISEQTLGKEADNSDIREKYEKADKIFHTWYKKWKDSLQVEYNNCLYEKMTGSDELYHKKLEEYIYFNPKRLTELIKSVDLVVLPKSLVSKIEEEIPEANIAILTKSSKRGSKASSNRNNYPRILIRHYKKEEKSKRSLTDPYGEEEASRIDQKTIDLLFKRQSERESWENVFSSGAYKKDGIHDLVRLHYEAMLGRDFYKYLKDEDYLNHVTRSKITIHHPDMLVGWHKRRIIPEGEMEVTANLYDLGCDKVKYLNTERIAEVTRMLDECWTTPLNSVEEIKDRQTLLGRLIEGEGYLEKVKSLAKGINYMVEPHIHLSSMAKLISSRILRSRWSTGKIHKETFYNDFIRISQEFVRHYEEIQVMPSSLETESVEMQKIMTMLDTLLGGNTLINKTYSFLKQTLDSAPNNFTELSGLFEKSLGESDAARIEELEHYDPRKDPTLDNKKIVERKKGSESLRGYKSDYLESLLKRFHSQNPVMCSELEMECLGKIGLRLLAYIANAEFCKDKGWVKPKITNKGVLNIRNGWYPFTKLQHSKTYIRNDTYLDTDKNMEILEGPNIAGKTIDLKKTMFIVVLALCGDYVPAEEATVPFFHRLRYRIKRTGMYDASALDMELKDLDGPLSVLGRPILMGIDETFTSTNDMEGEAMSYGVTKRLRGAENAMGIITSHYPSLHDILEDNSMRGVKFAHFTYEKINGEIFFPHKKMPGPYMGPEYAIVIAENQKVNPKIIAYAKSYIKNLKEMGKK